MSSHPDPSAIRIFEKNEVFSHAFFHGYVIRFEHPRFDGTMAGPFDHFVLERGDGVGMLLHDVPADEVILVEQFRLAALRHGSPWIIEVPAGRVETGDEPEATARREVQEETGVEPGELTLISSFFTSPGGVSEKLFLFYAPFPNGLRVADSGGLADEGEDIRIHRLPFARALAMIRTGEIADAKTIIALLWLQTSRLAKT